MYRTLIMYLTYGMEISPWWSCGAESWRALVELWCGILAGPGGAVVRNPDAPWWSCGAESWRALVELWCGTLACPGGAVVQNPGGAVVRNPGVELSCGILVGPGGAVVQNPGAPWWSCGAESWRALVELWCWEAAPAGRTVHPAWWFVLLSVPS
ncbi:hypothetical protein NDU88_005152 [Pleurodeles waltl]|uniref:Uncharacterized protein n=1 Tax=Pleurodeles waltl TaxID=8319 RepID=A0AAV7V6G4_PLEWA|nr:hypothetical protein NDU88_005152 [Pleurodeles waltl]